MLSGDAGDCLLMCDVVYEPHLFPLLLVRRMRATAGQCSARQLLDHSFWCRVLTHARASQTTMSELCGPETLVLLAYRRRNPDEWQVSAQQDSLSVVAGPKA